MAHSAMNRGKMLDWIRHNQEQELPDPTDEEIVEVFGFSSVLQARTLLAELVDQGKIHIIRSNGQRTGIGMGIARKHKLSPVQILPTPHRPVPKPAPTARRALIAAAAQKLGTSKNYDTGEIFDESERPDGDVSSVAPIEISERPEVETVEAQQQSLRNGQPAPASVDQGPRSEPPPLEAAEEANAPVKMSPQLVEAQQPCPAEQDITPRAQRRSRPNKRVEVYLPETAKNALRERADAIGVSTSRYAVQLLIEALTAPAPISSGTTDLAHADVAITVRSLCRRDRPPADVIALAVDALTPWLTPKRKPLISGAVIRAAAGQGMPLDAFVEHLIDLGMRLYPASRPEAAE